jgi:hypothetical protein
MTLERFRVREGRYRTVVIELDGILRLVPARATGEPVGCMETTRTFYADSLFGECPVPVAMRLHRPTADTDPRLIIVDDLAERWVMGFNVWYNQQRYRITAFYPVAHPVPTSASLDFRGVRCADHVL